MAKWIPCGPEFIEGDVIRWREAVWKPKARKTSRSVKTGERVIVAEVLADEGEWAGLLVKICETTPADNWWKPLQELKPGERLRRRRGPIGQSGAERLLWSDESARALVASRFMGPVTVHGPCVPHNPGQAPLRMPAILRLHLNPEVAATGKRSGDSRTPGAGKEIQHHVARRGEGLDDGLQDADAFLGRMVFVAGVSQRRRSWIGLAGGMPSG